uniref:Cytochrome b561 domain-containing protein n=1 Tax=Acrobeloides nanus TaxID=290746 RepID=A0A914C419_9BILA
MSLGMLYLNGEAILVYRGFRWAEKYRTKMVHLSLQAGAFLIALFGLKAAWDSHVLNKNPTTGQLDPIPNFYSLHSWIGISTLSLFFFQFLFGFVVFFCPGAPLAVRKKAMPLHRSIGMIIFVLSLGSALLGISERAAWKMTCWTKDHEMCSEMLITNFFGIILVCYACGVIILVSYSPWQRLPLPSEEMHVSQNDDDYGSDTAPFINNRRHDDD